MGFTYVPANIAPGNDDYLSAVRFLIQDTDEATAEIDDAEITALYSTLDTDNAVRAYIVAVALAEALHRRYAKQASFSSGKTSVQYTQRAQYWAKTIDDLRRAHQAAQQVAGSTDAGGVIYASRPSAFLDQLGQGLGQW